MPAERYYYPDSLETGQTIQLKDQEHHHLVNVMRTHLSDEIEIVNGKGQLAKAVLKSLEKKRAVLVVKSVQTAPDATWKIILAQGMPKQNKLEIIVEKGTELGMTELWLFAAARSEKKELSENQQDRLKTLAIAAMKQCGCLFLPKIVMIPPLKQWKNIEIGPLFFGDTTPDAPSLSSILNTLGPIKEAVFFVGPESGFSDEEINILHKLHAQGVKLHPNILRTETAAIAALTLLSQHLCYL